MATLQSAPALDSAAPAAAGIAQRRYALLAWFTLALNIAVILWGGVVRATGSGAGCGDHWPLCQAAATASASTTVARWIELSHRLSSSLAGLFVLALVAGAFRFFPRKHPVRWGSLLSLFFILTEGLIGASLVLLRLVAHNISWARAWWESVHLVNTLVLVAVLTLTAWWASGGASLRLRGQGRVGYLLAVGWFGGLLLGVSGFIAALGDTLFPVASFAEGVRQEFAPGAHLFLRLRLFHPAIAILVGGYLAGVAIWLMTARPEVSLRRYGTAMIGLVLLQWATGALDVWFAAPVWLQILHLFLADAVWIALVLFSASAFSSRPRLSPING